LKLQHTQDVTTVYVVLIDRPSGLCSGWPDSPKLCSLLLPVVTVLKGIKDLPLSTT